MYTQVPVAPLMYGADWSEFSTKNYTGLAESSEQPVHGPDTRLAVPRGDHPAPQASLVASTGREAEGRCTSDMTTNHDGRTPPGRIPGRAGAPTARNTQGTQ